MVGIRSTLPIPWEDMLMQERMMTETEQRNLEDFDWAVTAPEVQQHHGQLVVIRNRRVLAVGRDRQSLVAQAADAEHCAPHELLVMVVPPEGLWEIPH
jgi:hypothetical protein